MGSFETKNFVNPDVSKRIQELAISYGLPIAMAGVRGKREKDLRGKSNFSLVTPEFNTGVVRDMQRPSFALPAREPLGSSLAEQLAGQKFADSFQRKAEMNFNLQNEASKIGQEQQITERENKQAEIAANIQNTESQLNNQNTMRQLLMERQSVDEMLAGVYNTANSEFAQNRAADAMADDIGFKDAIRSIKSVEDIARIKERYPKYFT